MKNEIIYIVVRAENQAFWAAFDTRVAAEQFASVVRVPTEIIETVVKGLRAL